MNMKSKKFYFFIASFIIACDQIIKHQIMNDLPHYVINQFLSIDLVFNRGISWGLLHSDSLTVFACVNSAILFVIGALIVHSIVRMMQNHSIVAEIMVFAGAISNYVDRCCYEGVVDFISLSYGDWYFPIFNVADIFIVSGVGLMLLLEWKKS